MCGSSAGATRHSYRRRHLRLVAVRPAPSANPHQVSRPTVSGSGPSGLRPSHVHEALRQAAADLLLRLLLEVTRLLLQGEVPASARPFVCGASIMASRKANETLRPIATGETLWRLTLKIAVDLTSEHARAFLEPVEVGVQTRQWLRGHGARHTPMVSCSSAVPSTPFIVRLSSQRFVRTFHHWFRGLTAATDTTAHLPLVPRASHPRP